ncbi:MAG TPA: hypothetical protein VFU23_09080 [Gemmatimonadales bacterium]|nr:hypothetical protein [Gemmatimonadales bacterium]
MNRKSLVLAVLTLIPSAGAAAQDPFEIQVYEYATVPKGRWNLETHFNYTTRGTRLPEGTVAPSQGQSHLTFELTRGISDLFEMAGYVVLARRQGHGPDFVGWRLRPRVRAPETWKLPVRLSLSLEAGFPRDLYEEADATLEVRPIIERQFGRVLIDLNPVLGRSIKGPGSDDGWDFEPGARVGVSMNRVVELSVEYYGGLGAVGDFLPRAEQTHQFFGGGDFQVSETVVINAGLGLGVTDAGNRTVLKARIGWMF